MKKNQTQSDVALKTDKRTIDLTPLWLELLMPLLDIYESGRTHEAITLAKESLIDMAKAADHAAVFQNQLEAISARLNGVWDNKQLMKLGALGETKADVLRIIQSDHLFKRR